MIIEQPLNYPLYVHVVHYLLKLFVNNFVVQLFCYNAKTCNYISQTNVKSQKYLVEENESTELSKLIFKARSMTLDGVQ